MLLNLAAKGGAAPIPSPVRQITTADHAPAEAVKQAPGPNRHSPVCQRGNCHRDQNS